MSRLQKDHVVTEAIVLEGKCLLGSAADVYKNNGTLKKRYQEQVARLGLRTIKEAAVRSYTVQVYAVKPDYIHGISQPSLPGLQPSEPATSL